MRKYAAMGLTAVLAAASFPAAVLADEADVKSVRIGAPYDPVTMDYAELNVDPATYIDTLISDTLIRSKQGEYIGGAAESWETSEDGKTWTFKLKEGLTYSDGETPITSEDFVYAAKRLMDPEAGHYNAESGYILENGEEYYAGECEWDEVGIKAVDDLTIEYTFKNPQYESTFTSTSLFAPLEESFVDSLGTEYGSSADKILTNGPFIVSDWVSDSTMTLVKNENYWDADSINMDEMDFKFNVTGDTGVDMMLADELDFVPTGSAMQQQTLTDAGFESSKYTTSYRCLNINHAGKTADEIPTFELLCYESQGSIDVLAAVQDMLKKNLGIETTINSQTIQVMVSNAMSGDYDFWYGGNGLEIPDALSGFLSGYTSAMQSALRGYSNEEYDKLYDEAIASPTIEDRKANYFEVEKFFCDNTLNLILGWTDGGFQYKSGYTGFYNTVDTDFTYLDFAE